MLTRPLAVLATLAAVSLLASCGDDEGPTTASDAPQGDGPACTYTEDGQPAAKDVDLPPSRATVSGTVVATVETSIGELAFELDADRSPCTVNSFVSLAEQGYYDGTTCHRLTTKAAGISVLQCGDPTASGMGGPGYTIEDEVTPDTTYPAGSLAMAKTAAPDSGGSQFFVVYGPTPLPADYTVFGTVDDAGLQAVKEAAAEGTTTGAPDGQPKVAVDIETVTVED